MAEPEGEQEAGGVRVDQDGIPILNRPAWKTIRDLLPFMWLKGRRDLRLRVVGAFTALVLGRALGLYLPFVYKDIIDTVSETQGQGTAFLAAPLLIILGYGFLQIVSMVTGQIQEGLMYRVSEGMHRALSTRAFAHVTELSMGFHLRRSVSSLVRIVARGTVRADILLNLVVFNVVPMTIEFGVIAWLLIANFGWSYASVIGGTALVYIIYTLIIAERYKKYQRNYIDADQDSWRKFSDALGNVESVKNFTNETYEFHRYDHSREVLEQAIVSADTAGLKYSAGQSLIYRISLIALMLMVARDVVLGAGNLTVGSIVLIATLLAQFYLPIEVFARVYQRIRTALVDSEQLLTLLSMKPDISDRPDARDLAVSGGEIRFENVSFGYTSGAPILRGVSFSVPPGHKVAVVGRTGAGKSTVAKLLFRYFDVGEGRIQIDGQDIRDVTQYSLRDVIAIVPQETALFNDTIYYNIAYGRPDASPDEIIQAAKLAQIHDAVEKMPEGYDTIVGERGLKLSGGEKQRVAIARALLRDPKILVLDEATSSLDTRTEQEIQEALDRAADRRTTLVIAHRLSTIMNSDEILVLDEGRIIERGNHRTLLARGGTYAEMWARQAAPSQNLDEDEWS